VKSQPKRENGRVFKSRPDTITKAFNDAIVDARQAYVEGLTVQLQQEGLSEDKIDQLIDSNLFLVDLRFHDLRHEFSQHCKRRSKPAPLFTAFSPERINLKRCA
jgi:uncharacterized protein YcsI (UPF0317 family)